MKEETGRARRASREAVLERWSEAARRGEAPTREAWWDDLRRLGAIDLETADRLAGGGRAWPWIAPFELDQVEELRRRTVEAGAGELIRSAAAAELAAKLYAGADPFSDEPPPEPTRPRATGRPHDSASPGTAGQPAGSHTADLDATSALAGGGGVPVSARPAERQTASESPPRQALAGPALAAPARGTGSHDSLARPASSAAAPSPTASPLRVAAAAGGTGSAAASRRRRLIGGAAVLALLLVLGLVLLPGPPEAGSPEVGSPGSLASSPGGPAGPDAATEPPAPGPPTTSADVRELAPLLLELGDALQASADPRLRALFERRVEPLLTLDGEAMRHRPEMADAVTAAAWRRSGGHPVGLAREAPLLAAVHCGVIGPPSGEPTGCAMTPPVEALRGLVDWVWSSAEGASEEPPR